MIAHIWIASPVVIANHEFYGEYLNRMRQDLHAEVKQYPINRITGEYENPQFNPQLIIDVE